MSQDSFSNFMTLDLSVLLFSESELPGIFLFGSFPLILSVISGGLRRQRLESGFWFLTRY